MPELILQPAEPDQDVDDAIAACGGDMRATIKALLVANAFLTRELELMLSVTSSGYSRGRIRRPGKSKRETPSA